MAAYDHFVFHPEDLPESAAFPAAPADAWPHPAADEAAQTKQQQLDEEAELKLREQMIEALGHQCAECLADAHIVRLMELLQGYAIPMEVQEYLQEKETERQHDLARDGHANVQALKLPPVNEMSAGEVRQELTQHANIMGWDRLAERLQDTRTYLGPAAEQAVEETIAAEPPTREAEVPTREAEERAVFDHAVFDGDDALDAEVEARYFERGETAAFDRTEHERDAVSEPDMVDEYGYEHASTISEEHIAKTEGLINGEQRPEVATQSVESPAVEGKSVDGKTVEQRQAEDEIGESPAPAEPTSLVSEGPARSLRAVPIEPDREVTNAYRAHLEQDAVRAIALEPVMRAVAAHQPQQTNESNHEAYRRQVNEQRALHDMREADARNRAQQVAQQQQRASVELMQKKAEQVQLNRLVRLRADEKERQQYRNVAPPLQSMSPRTAQQNSPSRPLQPAQARVQTNDVLVFAPDGIAAKSAGQKAMIAAEVMSVTGFSARGSNSAVRANTKNSVSTPVELSTVKSSSADKLAELRLEVKDDNICAGCGGGRGCCTPTVSNTASKNVSVADTQVNQGRSAADSFSAR